MTFIGYDRHNTESPIAWDTTGANIVFMALESVVYFAIVLCIEYSLTFPTILAWLYEVPDTGFQSVHQVSEVAVLIDAIAILQFCGNVKNCQQTCAECFIDKDDNFCYYCLFV